MKKFVFNLCIIFYVQLAYAQEETLTLITYFPAPYGVYDTLRFSGELSRLNNTLYGTNRNTHINIGVSSTTGASGSNNSYCTVSGGNSNTASNNYSTVGGGYNNNASGNRATIGGGSSNSASAFGATIGGGVGNLADGNYSSVAGGRDNNATANETFIGGGYNNYSTGSYSAVVGGLNNDATGINSIVGGGANNEASTWYSTVPGGRFNIASGTCSFAAGYRAKAENSGCFVWADYTGSDYGSTANNQFRVRASGGAFLGGSPWSDIAEFMDVLESEEVQEGEILSLKTYDRLGKSTTPYAEDVIGVVSSKKTLTLHLGDEKPTYNNTKRVPVTLLGRVLVKVNDENGPINIGDPITSSSKPGTGMKATRFGKIIGYAMENLNNDDGEILVFVNLTYYIPPEEYIRMKSQIYKLEKRLSILEKKGG